MCQCVFSLLAEAIVCCVCAIMTTDFFAFFFILPTFVAVRWSGVASPCATKELPVSSAEHYVYMWRDGVDDDRAILLKCLRAKFCPSIYPSITSPLESEIEKRTTANQRSERLRAFLFCFCQHLLLR